MGACDQIVGRRSAVSGRTSNLTLRSTSIGSRCSNAAKDARFPTTQIVIDDQSFDVPPPTMHELVRGRGTRLRPPR